MRIIEWNGKQCAVKSETEHYYLVQQVGTEPIFSIRRVDIDGPEHAELPVEIAEYSCQNCVNNVCGSCIRFMLASKAVPTPEAIRNHGAHCDKTNKWAHFSPGRM